MKSHVIVERKTFDLTHTKDVITNYNSFVHTCGIYIFSYIDTGTQYVCLLVVLDFLNCDPVGHKKDVAGVHT